MKNSSNYEEEWRTKVCRLIIFGAGKIGELFCKEESDGIMKSYSEIYLYDNNVSKQKQYYYGYYVLASEEFRNMLESDDVEIIIATMKWKEIISESLIVKYINKVKAIYTFSNYDNMKSIKYSHNQYLLEKSGSEKFLAGAQLFDCINRVAIMLSNLCNYANIHKDCPAYGIKEKEIMPSKTVYKIIDELCESNFKGEICFHIYNEPLIDPRLFLFIQYIKQKIPEINIHIYSNGYYLNQTMVNELEMVGVTRITTTAYSKDEWKRLISLETDIAFGILRGNLDKRLELYLEREDTICSDTCMSYFGTVPIYVNGDIGTCCLDWKHAYKLGNVTNCTLREVINEKKIREFQMALLKGDRSVFSICSNCTWH